MESIEFCSSQRWWSTDVLNVDEIVESTADQWMTVKITGRKHLQAEEPSFPHMGITRCSRLISFSSVQEN